MPGLSLSPNRSRRSNRMCRLNARVHLSPEDAAAAERSFQIYCKPVELYNILQRRFEQNRYFLGRNLSYKIKGKQKKRLTTTVSVSSSSSMNKDELVQGIFPLYVLLASSISSGCHSAVFYCRTRAHVLESLSDFDDAGTGTGTGTGTTTAEASFVLPNKMNKLSSDESGSDQLFILLVSCGSRRNPLDDASSAPPTIGGYCLLGKIPVQSYISWDSVRTEHGSQMLATVEMHACFLESTTLDSSQSIAFKTPDCPVSMPVRVTILTREVGEKDPTPYSSFTHTASLTQFPRLRNANVVFNYKYYNNTLQETEATEDFACPFCLFKCASFMGIRCHLAASHDLFHYEFWVTEEYQAVNVSVKTDIWRSEIAANRFDPRLHTFFLCLKRLKRAASKHSSQNANHVLTSDHNLGSGEVTGNGLFNGLLEKGATTSSLPVPSTTNPLDRSDQAVQVYDNGTQSSRQMDKAQMAQNNNDLLNLSNGGANASVAECLELVATSPNVTGPSTATNQSSADLDCPSLVSERNLVPPPMLQFAKSRKLSADRSDPRNRMLLQKRLFFHSHRAQPMEMEQVLSDCDSEDEVDDDIADLEDRRMLDDFVDVTKDEKQMMHLWNSFVRRQRVLADGHIPWACEAFSKMHGPKLVESPPLLWCWRLFMIKLWNHSLLDGSTMDKCNTILSDFNNNSIDPPQS